MNIKEIELSLPNGLHDAFLMKLYIDYLKRKATFDLDVWMGDPSSKDKKLRETYKKGRLIVHDLIFCTIEPPDSKYPYKKPDHLRFY